MAAERTIGGADTRAGGFCLIVLACLAAVGSVSSQVRGTAPDADGIVARMAKARADNTLQIRAYVVTRDYEMFRREKQRSVFRATADMTFVPPNLKHFSIQQSSGGGLGETIVRRMLADEVNIAKEFRSTDFTHENYQFRLSREEEVNGQTCHVLQLLPRRNDKHLLRGDIWVDTKTFLVHRAEGEPAKTPSWWIRDLRIVLVYGEAGGMWLQTASTGTATVPILGRMTVVSRNVSYRFSEIALSGLPATAEGYR